MTKLPHVTDVLRHFFPLNGIDPRVLEEAQERGADTHAAAHYLATGQPVPESWKQANPRRWENAEPYIAGAEKFLRETKFIVQKFEQKVINEALKYQGRYDWKGAFPCGQRAARIDLKTGDACPDITGVQLALYDLADERTNRFALWLPGNGSYRLVPFRDPADYAVGTRLMMTYHDLLRYGVVKLEERP